MLNKTLRHGFTMIELLVVATIIIVLTMVGMVSFRNATLVARDGKRRADLETIRSALVLYKTDSGAGLYPATTAYSTMINTLVAADYLDSNDINDPNFESKGTSYTYSSAVGRSFELCATLEKTEETVCVENP